MTAIAVMTIPVAVLGAIACLYAMGKTINVMTLAGLALAIGPLVDSAIICLENTHRHLGLGARPKEAAFLGASEVAMPELVASLCTLLVLVPLALMPGLGAFLFRPMVLAVAFAMSIAYILSRTFVPARCAAWLRGHRPVPVEAHAFDYQHRNEHEHRPLKASMVGRVFAKWEAMIDAGIAAYTRLLDQVLKRAHHRHRRRLRHPRARHRGIWLEPPPGVLPEVDAGAFEMFVRTKSGTRIEVTEGYIEAVENYMKKKLGDDLEMVISEIGVTADWSAAFTPNAGPMDAVIKVQLKHDREHSAQEAVDVLRRGFVNDPEFQKTLNDVYDRRMYHPKTKEEKLTPDTPQFLHENLEFAFDAGGMIRSAMNEGQSTPINVRITRRSWTRPARSPSASCRSETRRRRGRCPHHPAARLPAVRHRGGSVQGLVAAIDPDRRDAERRRRVQ